MRVLLEKDGPYIAVITIDNQRKLNAMSREMMQLLGSFWVVLGPLGRQGPPRASWEPKRLRIGHGPAILDPQVGAQNRSKIDKK